MPFTRRRFMKTASGAALGATVASGPARATASGRGSIQDVEHVVILMQENRSFDHYFGALRGVRGFDDPHPVLKPNGDPVWMQKQLEKDGGETIMPFRLNTGATAAQCLTGLDHSWKGSHDRWKNYDVWMPEKGPMSMGHLTREDIPYYYALADAFTICDAYHASVHGPTGPNRLFLFSGTNGLSVGQVTVSAVTNDGSDDNGCADMAKDDPAFPGYAWTPYAARLEAAGISWKVYQEYDNYSDNPLAYFPMYRNLDRGSVAYQRARAWVAGSTKESVPETTGQHLVDAFAADVAADTLPAVSWIVAPFKLCEHPDAPPAYGETLTARLVAVLGSNPDVWKKTVFILNYDENDGFFDHVPPPIPAIRPDLGASTVDLRGEDYHGEPVGLGFRVPMLIVSPWTRGGWVNSQVFDHTSVLRFLERRFGVAEPNIGPWRRAVCGDLTSAFDFDISEAQRRDTSWLRQLPETGDFRARSDASCRLPKATYAQPPAMPRQEPGVRPARPLPYDLEVQAHWTGDQLTLRFPNRGEAGAVFTVYRDGDGNGPRYYTVEAGKSLSGVWPVARSAETEGFAVHGPAGFYRAFRGGRADAGARPMA
ncbi:phosphocholine-specific phospholipase C [Caulobacter sp. Root1472]|uniref:phosphocholine-specific phospholipase C n=1 Tax=Caulobacter sp. Root1472 TaxID=1736470 RepID=UPI0007000422|nr:phospholipase C, phosphocholine-specific [Caulobacter sp. Root1472]KQZ33141.1 phospholipase C, phosphocholine-specific [Caulobacter sp. Root1472]